MSPGMSRPPDRMTEYAPPTPPPPLGAKRALRIFMAWAGGEAARAAVGWRGAKPGACARAALQGLGLLVAFVVARAAGRT
jgi:hypothetical protein